MGNIQYWQLATDGLLVLALFFLAIRFTRSSAGQLQNKTQELARGLKMLIKEADKAGQSLNETLMHRQSELKGLLNEIKEAEERIGDFEGAATQEKQALDEKLDAAKEVIQGIEGALSVLETHAQDLMQTAEAVSEVPGVGEQSVRQGAIAPQQVSQPVAPQPQRQQAAPQPQNAVQANRMPAATRPQQASQPLATTKTPLSAAVERTAYESTPEPASFKQSAAPARGTTNIYGDPIQKTAESEQPAARQPVARQQAAYTPRKVEDESRERASASLKQIHYAAEQLLRAGYDLRTVSAKTRLSIDEVRMLSQVIADEKRSEPEMAVSKPAQAYQTQNQPEEEGERQSPVFAPNEVATSRADDRLGVLGNMKRDRYTV